MCGIAGMIDFEKDLREREKILLEMQSALRRRGPDEDGIYLSPQAALAHTRLCVVDPENGRQPMTVRRAGRTCTLVYNGELYNTPELRRELSAVGWDFTGHSDTEVLLKAYMEWGPACVDRLNGIFAFAAWDGETLFLARDRMGVKPLFYSLTAEGTLVFASEIKALLRHPDIPPKVDAEGVAELLLIGPGRTPGQGVFRNVRELLPGQCGVFGREGLRLWSYWRLTARPHLESEADTVAHVRDLVRDAIRRQLVSDVPVGTFLSGGLDSSVISAVAAETLGERGERLRTFSVDYRENDRYFTAGKFQPSADGPYIKAMADDLDTLHTNVVLDPVQVAAALDDAAEARDLPGMADVDS